ncbi:MAG TPA: ABC transporter permease [Ohtaekwangia sp.]|nr:ABC transporter permease [Ohtaekwangia sp.]
MLKHNLLLIYRNFKRFKSTFFINLVGLSAGLACTLLIHLWVDDELRIDRFHEKADRLLQVMEHQQHAADIRVTDSTPGALAETLADEIPEVEYATVVTPTYWFDKFMLSREEKKIDATGIYASNDYFNVFSYGLVQGDKDRVLSDKNSIVISESVAKALFNTTNDLVGKAIEFQHEKEFLISGVFKDVPAHASARFDFVLPFPVAIEMNPGLLNWGNSGPMTFVVLKEGSDPGAFDKKISGLIKAKTDVTHRTLFSRKFTDAYLYGGYENGVQTGGRIEYVILFSVVAIFILAIACINFMNLSTAKASRRIKEVGIKKVVGASRRALIFQYMGESMFMTFLSLSLSILIVDIFLPQFNDITGKQLALQFDLRMILSFLCIATLTGILAGSYPALYISRFSPASVLKGKLDNAIGELFARKGLVVFQFSLSVVFIVSVLVIYRQIKFLQTKNLGYDKENVIYFQREGRTVQSLEPFLIEMRKIPGIISASSIGQSMVGGGNTTDLEWEGKDPAVKVPFAIRPVSYDVIEMLDIEITKGRAFSRDFPDSAKVIFNQAAMEVIGFEDPIGKTIDIGGGVALEIIGIAKNFHFESLRTEVKPMMLVLVPQYTEKIIAKIEAGKEQETLARLQDFYVKFNPGFDFDYRFMDADYQQQYGEELRISKLSKYFAGLAILISCLGLFGLAAFTAERRTKEIGIRKALGSSVGEIVYLLTSDFTRIVLLAVVIALPVSFFITHQWLDNFAYRIPLEWWYFGISGLLAICIAWLTVGTQAIKAARINPAKCLKDE